MTSKHSLGDRLHPLVVVLCLCAGFFCVHLLWTSDWFLVATEEPISIDGWRTFAGIVTATAATMVGFLATIAALIYAISPSPLMQHLKETGHVRRVLFDLFAAVVVWLLAMAAGLFASLPGMLSTILSVKVSIGFLVSGLLLFVPVGRSFWLLMGQKEPPAKTSSAAHDWDAPISLED